MEIRVNPMSPFDVLYETEMRLSYIGNMPNFPRVMKDETPYWKRDQEASRSHMEDSSGQNLKLIQAIINQTQGSDRGSDCKVFHHNVLCDCNISFYLVIDFDCMT